MKKIVFSNNGREVVRFEIPDTDLDYAEKDGYRLHLKPMLPALFKDGVRINKYDKMEITEV
jgi:hypothetical protein